MTTEVARQPPEPQFEVLRPEKPAERTVEEVIAQVRKIQLVMANVMREGEHYGVIPGTSQKKSLFKPGAEILCLTFRLDPEYSAVQERDGAHLIITSTCTLYNIITGQRFGSGMGSCSTLESKYAFRNMKPKCPKCGHEVNRSKRDAGFYCWAKTGGCGGDFKEGSKEANEIAAQPAGKVPNDSLPDTYNTVLKMANKRSLVAAVLNATAASDMFTQDLEDLDEPMGNGNGKPLVNESRKLRPDAPPPKTTDVELDQIHQEALLALGEAPDGPPTAPRAPDAKPAQKAQPAPSKEAYEGDLKTMQLKLGQVLVELVMGEPLGARKLKDLPAEMVEATKPLCRTYSRFDGSDGPKECERPSQFRSLAWLQSTYGRAKRDWDKAFGEPVAESLQNEPEAETE